MKNYIKYIGGFVGIALVGAAILWGVSEYRYRKSPEYQAIKYFDDLKSKYENDTYGGATPEETLQLFIDALKKGDVELASKYFMIEDQEEQKKYLKEVKEEGLLESMIDDLGKTKLSINEDKAFFTLVENKRAVAQLVMYKNSKTGKWKISEL
ncbi:MAG: hypothetical protein AAB950_00520 [Patescibacteria group bacterium]